MSEFKRGIAKPNFIAELNNNKYWQQMVKDEDLFIAIRNDYLNVYYYGQSICKVEFVKNSIKWTSHKKYLGINENGYADASAYLENIGDLKRNAKEYCGREKEQVKKVILSDKRLCILDVEVTFGREENSGKKSIDFLTVEKGNNGKSKLVFYEAKHFGNPEIRSRNIPRVFNQMEKYESVLRNPLRKSDIINSYRTIYENIKELNLNNKENIVQLIGAESYDLDIDTEPRLIIFEIDNNNKEDIHLSNLKRKFGDNRLILKFKDIEIS